MTYGPEQWDQDADFDRWYCDTTGRLIEGRLEADTLLEIGCASGRMTQYFVCPGRRVTAVTLNAEAAERARARNLDGVDVLCGDVMNMGSPVGVFDAIVCCLVLHEVVSPQSMMRKAHELLAPGGRVFVTVPSANSIHRSVAGGMSERARRFGVRRELLPEEWHTELISGTGLRVVAREEIMLKPYPNERMECLTPTVLDHLAAYRGPGGTLCYFELEAAV